MGCDAAERPKLSHFPANCNHSAMAGFAATWLGGDVDIHDVAAEQNDLEQAIPNGCCSSLRLRLPEVQLSIRSP